MGDEAGMLLFPGEEDILDGVPGFSIEIIEYMDTPGMKLLMCDGECDRNLRPLACRMFPAAPRIGNDGRVSVIPDIRGRRMCPLWELNFERVDKKFVKSVGRAFELLARDEKMLEFMRLVSSEIDEINRFFG